MATAPFAPSIELALPKWEVQRLVTSWLAADAPAFEVGGFVVGEVERTARLLGKSPGVFCGRVFAQAAFDAVGGLQVEWFLKDGDVISVEDAKAKKPVAIVRGKAKSILLAERTALNVISRASGVATLTRRMLTQVRSKGWQGHLAATRKTTPGFALVEKYAVLVGGASTHRIDLSQMTMLKDNHVWSVGSITKAVKQAKVIAGFSSKIEVEARSFEEACEAADAGADVVMLDNMTPAQIKTESARLKAKYPYIVIEASGGINEDSITEYLCPTVDVVSVGKLTQGYACLDFSLKVDRPQAKL